MRLAATLLAAAVLAATQAAAADAPERQQPRAILRGAVSGVAQRIAFLDPLNPDCTNAGRPVVHTLLAPQHGALQAIPAEGYSSYSANAQQYACNLHKTTGVALVYRSQSGFAGDDLLAVSLIYPDGQRILVRFLVTVEPAAQLNIPREGWQQV